MAQRINLLCEELYRLYFGQQLTFAEIARRFGCSPVTVHKRLKSCGFQARPAGGSVFEYPKKDFDGSLCDKAYLIGLRLGDLHVEKGNWAIRIRCTSTHPEQIELIHDLFCDYGGVWISEPRPRRGTGITVHLNRSFDFLPSKETLLQLCNILSPYLRHRKRIRAMEAARANVASRLSD